MFALLRARLPHIGRGPRLLVAATCVLLALGSALGGHGTGHDAGSHGAGLAGRLPAGSVAAAVSLDDPSGAALVRAGDRVDILESPRPVDPLDGGTTPSGPVDTVVRHGLVLHVVTDRGDGGAALVLAVDRVSAVRLIRDRSTQVFTAVVVPP